MNLHILQWRSIKTRVTLFTLAIFLISTLALAFYGRGILRQAVPILLGEQQFSTASFIAAGVNQELDDRLKALEAVARTISPAMLENAAAIQMLLEQLPALQGLFNAGAFVTRPDGVATASIPRSTQRIGISFKEWDFVASALMKGKATVGQAAIGKSNLTAIVGMAVPIRDDQGRVAGVLVGVTDLNKSSFLSRFAEGRYGKTGGYVLVSAQGRAVVAGRDSSGFAEALPGVGVSPLIDRFIQGYEGSGVLFDGRGMEVLASAKWIPLAGWSVVVTLPIEEAFAPFHAARKHMLLAAIVLALLAGAVIWWLVRRELAPMLTAMRTLSIQSNSDHPPMPLAVTGQDEIAELIGGFNRLLATLAQREQALMEVEAELRIAATAFESHEGMMVTDANSVILRVNQAFTATTGYTAEEAVGQTPKLLKSGRHDVNFYREMWEIIHRHDGWQGEIWDRHKNGAIYPKWLTISAVKDRNGVVTHYVGAHFDITERKQMEDQVRQLAFYDPLTQLPNRRLLDDRLHQSLAASKRSGCYGAMMVFDLDNFKPLNDTHGHPVGDLLLIAVARRVAACVRESDTVARFGGDEFVVLLSDLDADRAISTAQAGLIAEKIRASLAAPYRLSIGGDGRADAVIEYRCSASIGVALYLKHEAKPREIFTWADAAMYRAKQAGRNSIQFHGSI